MCACMCVCVCVCVCVPACARTHCPQHKQCHYAPSSVPPHLRGHVGVAGREAAHPDPDVIVGAAILALPTVRKQHLALAPDAQARRHEFLVQVLIQQSVRCLLGCAQLGDAVEGGGRGRCDVHEAVLLDVARVAQEAIIA
eukprot:1158621-Pelagomonas_calceolata.AAC.7